MYIYGVLPLFVCRNEAMPYLSTVLAFSETYCTLLRSVGKSFKSQPMSFGTLNVAIESI